MLSYECELHWTSAFDDASKIEEQLNLAEYQETGLMEAHAIGNEVMLFCESYMAIPISLLPTKIVNKPQNIIWTNGSWHIGNALLRSKLPVTDTIFKRSKRMIMLEVIL